MGVSNIKKAEAYLEISKILLQQNGNYNSDWVHVKAEYVANKYEAILLEQQEAKKK